MEFPLSFVVVGSGFRSLFYARIAKRFPQFFTLKYLLCRTEEKTQKLNAEYGIPTTTSQELCMEAKPDFVVVAVNRNSVWSVAREWIKAGFPVLLETPVGHTEEELKEAWEMSLHGAKIQVAEQYHRYPILAAGIKAVKEGLIGDPYGVTLSMAHDYHGASLIREMLNIEPMAMTLRGNQYRNPVTQTDSRYGPITDGSVTEQERTVVQIEFANGKTALYDFAGIQYRTFIRARHVNVQGQNGEWNDSLIRYVREDLLPEMEYLKPYLDPKYKELETGALREICRQWNPVFAMEAEQDEYAIATMMYDMKGYLEKTDPGYPLREALEDAYTWILFQRAVEKPWQTIESEPMPWHDR